MHVRDLDRAPPAAHPGVLDALGAVAARAGERDAERAGHRRLGPARVDRAVTGRIAPARAESPGGARARRHGGREHQRQRRDARRDPVHDVVEARRDLAEPLVPRRAVTDHRVEGIQRLVGAQPRQPQEQIREHRRDDPVAEVLRRRLDGRAGNAGAIEAPRIAADDVRHLAASGLQALGEPPRDRSDVLVQAAKRDERAREDRLHDGARRKHRAQGGEAGADEGGRTDHRDGDERPRCQLDGGRRYAGEGSLERVDEGAEERHRVRDVRVDGSRIADQGVEEQGERDDRGVLVQLLGSALAAGARDDARCPGPTQGGARQEVRDGWRDR